MENSQWNTEVNALLFRIQTQDKLALKQLYELTSSKLLGLIYRIIKDHAEAEELLQEVFIKVWHQADKYRGEGSALAWLCVMARNASLDRLRKAQKHPHISTDEHQEFISSLTEEFDESSNIALNRCLYKLKEQARESVLLSYVHGYSHSELAHKMAVPLGTMKAWIRRGLQELKLCLKP
ncbi:sigma-70 family RNA polymerase sigma factor [Marinomonas sp. C2222]|uniref:Sigma-70 family RNA polymerase sigma factor n=1 Tax=Marinomonas sargassi TaxID=2984494 RepID=A0ABT2YTU8_9GAMM|nr:sigma-70 family RNA polymerase sigma factor [Marinomonas sargassi]MCV2403190.1 sigma-70 family RNA polymerase sigma factor [Marinomonas sargassi]